MLTIHVSQRPADQTFIFISNNGNHLFLKESFGVKDIIVYYNMDDENIRLLNCPEGVIYNAFQNNNNEIIIIQNSPNAPLYLSIFDKKLNYNIKVIEPFDLNDEMTYFQPQIINFITRSGHVESIVYNPKKVNDSKGVIFYLHGGPVNQWYFAFEPIAQLLVQNNYVVVCPNFKGSTGYGKEYILDLKGKWGEVDLDQLIEIKKEICTSLNAKAAVIGNSYGGYLSALAAAKHSHEWECAISISGFYSIKDLFNQGSYGVKRLLTNMANYEPNNIHNNDPIRNYLEIETDILVIHGLRDTRIPIEQARNMINKLKETKKVNYEYYELKEMNHDLFGFSNRKKVYRKLLTFIEMHMNTY